MYFTKRVSWNVNEQTITQNTLMILANASHSKNDLQMLNALKKSMKSEFAELRLLLVVLLLNLQSCPVSLQ